MTIRQFDNADRVADAIYQSDCEQIRTESRNVASIGGYSANDTRRSNLPEAHGGPLPRSRRDSAPAARVCASPITARAATQHPHL